MQKRVNHLSFLLLFLFFILSSCDKNSPQDEKPTGKLQLTFKHYNNGQEIKFDTLMYKNAAGNKYLVNEIQYFISDVRLWKNGKDILLDKWEDIHYVDPDLPDTWDYKLADDIPADSYDSISFVFGITKEKNQSFMFVNPPESYMFWPEYLGGGYHYMKLNGKWIDLSGVSRPFNFHLGIGQIYDENGNIIKFVQNYFTVHLYGPSITIKKDNTTQAIITMNVENWFEEPNIFDFNYWGGDIMENQAAMQAAKENGYNVFSIEVK
jgi:hypothetical protein